MRACLAAVVVWVVVGCAGPGREGESLAGLMVERLSWMDEVAQVKKAKGLPVEDAKREAEVLDAMVASGVNVGLPGGIVRGFFAGQMEAAKVHQEEWLTGHPGEWQGELPDLQKTVRPALDGIGERMIIALRRARAEPKSEGLLELARRRLVAEGYSQRVIAEAMSGLAAGLGPLESGSD